MTLQTRRRLVGDGPQVHHRLHGVDELGEVALDHISVDVLDRRRGAGDAFDGMQDHEAGAVGDEVGDAPRRVPEKRSVPSHAPMISAE